MPSIGSVFVKKGLNLKNFEARKCWHGKSNGRMLSVD